jgi:protease I
LLEPKKSLEEQGATVEVISIDGNSSIKGWNEKDWGKSVAVDKQIEDADINDYQRIALPGGQMNPDVLRMNEKVIEFIKAGHGAKNIA